MKGALAMVALFVGGLCSTQSFANECPSNWKTLHPEWIWCDDFETNKLSSYFDRDSPTLLARTAGVGFNGSYGMQAIWTTGLSNAGSMKLAFGLTPSGGGLTPPAGVDTTTKFREVYYRVYLKTQAGWINPRSGNGAGNSKFSRATVFSASDWSQAMIAHVWSDETNNSFLMSDPVTCVLNNSVVCVGYNDFSHFAWLGGTRAVTAMFASPNLGTWKCIEHHVRLNDPGQSNGVSEFWVDDQLEASKADMNFVGTYSAFAINSIFLENYVNTGSPQSQSRYWDNFVVSTQRIGCAPSAVISPPTNLRVS